MDNPFKQILNQEELPNKLKGKIMEDISFIKLAIDVAEMMAVNYPESIGNFLTLPGNNLKDNS